MSPHNSFKIYLGWGLKGTDWFLCYYYESNNSNNPGFCSFTSMPTYLCFGLGAYSNYFIIDLHSKKAETLNVCITSSKSICQNSAW